MNGHRPAKIYFLFVPVEDDGAYAREDDNDQPEKFPQRGKVFSPCKQKRGSRCILAHWAHQEYLLWGSTLLQKIEGKAILRRRKQLFRNHGCPSPIKYHPLRLVSWVNSIQCSFTPILKMPSEMIKNVNDLEEDLKASRRVARRSLQGGMWAFR